MVKAVPLTAVAIFAGVLVAIFASGSVVRVVALATISIRPGNGAAKGPAVNPRVFAGLRPKVPGKPNAPLAGTLGEERIRP
jgi:hypothetical protein